MSATSVEIQWQTTVRPGGPALGVSVAWSNEYGANAMNFFSLDWQALAAAKRAGQPYTLFDLLELVLSERNIAEAVLRAQRYGLVMPCSCTVH